jgi:uncharacterized protein
MGSTFLRVRLTPRGGRNTLDRFEGDVLYARVASPPVEGAANSALVELLAETLGIRKRAIIIVSGATSREKRVKIEDMTSEQLVERIARALPGGDA